MNDDELDPEEEKEEEEEQEQENEQEQQGPNPEKAKDEVKQKVEKAKKMKEKMQKVEKAQKAAKKAKQVKAAAKFASGAKKFALLANPYFWIAMLIILAIIVLIGLIMSFTIMPSNFLGKAKQFVEGMMKDFCGLVWGDSTSSISNGSDEVKDLANYIQNMGYDIQGYGFGDVEYTSETKDKQKEVNETDERANAVEGKRNYVTEEQATQGGEIKRVFGLQAVTTVSSDQYEDGDEMYKITGRFSSKNNDYLRAYLSAEAATYTEARYSIKGWFNELGDAIVKGLDDIFGGHSSQDWEDPGDVGVKSASTGMLNFTNAGGNNIFNSTLDGSPTRIKIDVKNKKLLLYEKALSLGLWKIQWGQTFSVDLSNWTAIYGRPLELFLALHLSSMMPDLPYQMAVDQAFNTKVNIGLQDATINFDTHMKIEGHQVTFGENDVKSETGQENKEENLDKLVDKFLLEQLGATNPNSFWNKIRDHLYDQNFARSVGGEENAKKYRRCVVEAFQDQLNIDDTTTGWLGNKDAINYRAAMAQADKYFREQSQDANAARKDMAEFIKEYIIDKIKNIGDDVWSILTDVGGFVTTVLADIVNLFGNFFEWLDGLLPPIEIDMGDGFLSKLANWVLPEYDPDNPQLLSYKPRGSEPISEEVTTENEDGTTTTTTEYTEEAKKGGGFLVVDLFGTIADTLKDLADSMMDLFYVKIETGSDTSGISLVDDQGSSFTANLSNDDYQDLTRLVAAGLGGTSIKWPYIESVTNHWYYHIIDFFGTVGKDTLYGAYKKAATAKKTIKYSDEEGGLDGYEIELTALLSSDEGIFYQVCEPYLNEKPNIYLKKIFHGAYYKYDGTTETARKITAARAIEAEYETDDYDDSKFEKDPQKIVDKNIKYNWHSSESDSAKLKITLEDATEYVSAKKAQVAVTKKSKALIKADEEEEKGNPDEAEAQVQDVLDVMEEDGGEIELEELGEESPMCKKLVDFKSDKSNTLEAFSILENVNSEAADVNYRLLKKLMVEMDYFTEDEMNSHEKNILLWITNVEGTKGADVAATINRNLGKTDNGKNKTISDTGRDSNEYGVVISNFMENTQIIAPGDAKVKSVGSDEHGNYIEIEFTTLTDDKVYPLQGTMMLLHQDDERDPFYNQETPYDREPLYSAAEVMRRYRFKDTFQVFEDDDLVGITMKISGLRDIKVSAGDTVLRGEEIAGNPETATEGEEDSGDKIYVSMKKADKTKVENVEDYIDPVYTYEDEKDMAEELWYLDHPEYGNRYNTGGNLNIDYVEWALQQAENSLVGYCQTHRYYNENSNGCLDVDCSAFVYYALLNNNYDVRKYSPSAFTTGGGERETLTSLGFTEMDFPGPNNCQKGDILWRDGHTEIYSGDGKSVGAHGADNLPGGHPSGNTGKLATNGDQTGGEVSEVSCSSNWTKIFRPPLSVGSAVGLANAAGYQPNWNNDAAWQSPSNPLAAGFMGQCTYFAWGCSYELYGFACWDGCGNGIDVARSVVRCNPDKFKLSSTPVPGAIFSKPSGSIYGHTGVVLEVNPDGSCVIFDGNYDGVTNSSFEATKHDCGTRTIRFPAGSYFACPIEPKK